MMQAAAAKHNNLRDVLSLFFRDDITAWYRFCCYSQYMLLLNLQAVMLGMDTQLERGVAHTTVC